MCGYLFKLQMFDFKQKNVYHRIQKRVSPVLLSLNLPKRTAFYSVELSKVNNV